MTASQAAQTLNSPLRAVNKKSTTLPKGREVNKKHLINALNHINFKEQNVILVFTEPYNDTSARIEAYPMPVLSDYPTFKPLRPLPQGFTPEHLTGLIIPDGTGEIHAIPSLRAASSTGLSIILPETGQRVQGSFRDIRVHFLQKGIKFKGSLTSLDPDAIKIELSPISAHYLSGISLEDTLRLTFVKKKNPLFETEATVIKHEYDCKMNTLHLKPISSIPTPHDEQHFRKKAVEMVPSPDLQFSHPLTSSRQTVVIDSLSGVNLRCTLHEEIPPLLPGMKLNKASIVLGNVYSLEFNGEISRCTTTRNIKGEKLTICSIRISGMSEEDHLKLQNMVHKSENRHIGISTAMDSDDLWRFFFETNFIYKNKYKLFLNNKKKIKKTYKALYSAPTDVTRHVVYREKGQTMGHASMLRYAENAWLFHHHAALKGASMKVGLGVLNHMNHYLYDSLWQKSAGIKYLLLYFRPENSFPNFVFNGFTQKMENSKISSVDLFAYSYFHKHNEMTSQPCHDWILKKASKKDLAFLEENYELSSGGLLIEALDLLERQAPADRLSTRYNKSGLKKERHLWAIRQNEVTIAVLIVNTSDLALNMSELTNCIKVCIIKPKLLTKKMLTQALNMLSKFFETSTFPVLTHPFNWVENSGFNYQKKYLLWAFNTQFSEQYMQYFSDLLEIANSSKKQ